MSDAQQRMAFQFIQAIPHAKALGMQILEINDGHAIMDMPYDERFIGDPNTGVIHGGAVSALLDSCAGASVMSHPKVAGGTATIDLRIDYMRPATPGQRIKAEATCYNMTSSVAFVRAAAYDEDETRPVAMATGAFTAGGAKNGA